MQTSSDGPAAKRQRIGPPTAEVRYADAESAVRALLELSGSEFDDNMLVVSPVESNDKAMLVVRAGVHRVCSGIGVVAGCPLWTHLFNTPCQAFEAQRLGYPGVCSVVLH